MDNTPKRVLFLGVAGVAKLRAMINVKHWIESHGMTSENFEIIDFEKEYLFNPKKGGRKSFDFLVLSQAEQRKQWDETWSQFVEEKLNQNADLFIGMHGCFITENQGVRIILSYEEVFSKIQPMLVVHLIDDVYKMWWETQRRAGKKAFKGKPSLEHLLIARRTESVVAHQIAHMPIPRLARSPIPHLTISVTHPCASLANKICNPDARVVYLSFPISAPRRLLHDKNDASGIKSINEFHKQAYAFQDKHKAVTIVSPLGIDELPLVSNVENPDFLYIEKCREIDELLNSGVISVEIQGKIYALLLEKPQVTLTELVDYLTQSDASKEELEELLDRLHERIRFKFDAERLRWKLDDIWKSHTCLNYDGGVSPVDGDLIPVKEINDVARIIRTDVKWRDYSLVEQAQVLAVFNPIFKGNNRKSRGVDQEITSAINRRIPCFVYQDKRFDPEGLIDKEYYDSGTMDIASSEKFITLVDSVEEIFSEILNL